MSTTSVIPVNRTVNVEKSIVVIECANCSIDFGIGAVFQRRRRDDHETFYCPNGHGNHYPGPSDAEKERERLAGELDAARSLAARESRRRADAENTARRKDYEARAAKGQLTKTKKRVAAGVCPCCNRSFQNLAKHMAGQHPSYAGGDQ
ncbi:hypothetical protein KVF89_22530 [Nocardioides carbamazepini]|uniref:hypothetical protein n=1 Tax=Nocardioides carbamazepini TaxID=2854259 RepID=UPI00214A556C|nr:hypothetical protein [Nocardioides carbamazepini]MCR1785334.1 hypothetical protein [Nocardioides carbamazepini]